MYPVDSARALVPLSTESLENGQETQPLVFPPFKFEIKRFRIDWRQLNAVDVNAIIRNTDIDALEKIVSIISHGDIEAEDAASVSQANLLKIYKLAQLTVEYLLYAQDSLHHSATWLNKQKATSEKHLQATRLRCKELDTELKVTKRELKHTLNTVKMLANNSAAAAAQGTQGTEAAAENVMLRQHVGQLSNRLATAVAEMQQMQVRMGVGRRSKQHPNAPIFCITLTQLNVCCADAPRGVWAEACQGFGGVC